MANGLVGLGALAAAPGHPAWAPPRAAVLLAAAETHLAAVGAVLEPTQQALRERTVGEARAALSPEEFAASWAEGQALTLDQALALAVPPLRPPDQPSCLRRLSRRRETATHCRRGTG